MNLEKGWSLLGQGIYMGFGRFIFFATLLISGWDISTASAAELRIAIRNKTWNRNGQAEQVRVLEISKKMKDIYRKNHPPSVIRIDGLDEKSSYLVQTVYKEVRYYNVIMSKDITKAADSVVRVEVPIYETRHVLWKRARFLPPDTLQFRLPYLTIRKEKAALRVLESIEIHNEDKYVYIIDDGIRLHIRDPRKGSVTINLSYNDLPMHQDVLPPKKEGQPWTIRNVIKPGITYLDIGYQSDTVPLRFSFPFAVKNIAVFVLPVDADVQITAGGSIIGIRKVRENTKDNYLRYAVASLPTGKELQIDVAGGTPVEPRQAQGKAVKMKPEIHNYPWILGLVAVIILLAVLYRIRAAFLEEPSYGRIIDRLASLQMQRERDEIPPEKYQSARDELIRKAIELQAIELQSIELQAIELQAIELLSSDNQNTP